MKKMYRLVHFVFWCGILGLVTLPNTVWAVSFPADYDVTYELQADGKVHVIEKITITNQNDNQYPSQYSLALEKIDVENITAHDDKGALEVHVEKIQQATLLTVHFKQIVIGKGKQLVWTLEYDAPTLLEKKGKMWEIALPQFERDEQIGSYKILIKSAIDLGNLDYSDPLPDSYERDEQFRYLRFDFTNRQEPIGVTMAFGEVQLVNTRLLYHLQNTQDYTALYEIALPPSLHPYQKTYIQSLIPDPYEVRIDEEGNVFAQYKLKAKERLLVEFNGQIVLWHKTLTELTATSVPYPGADFLTEDTYWETSAPVIQEIAKKLNKELGDSATQEQKARAVYDYVTQTLMYDTKKLKNLENVERYGAVRALKVPDQAICIDFTDVTVTLMRALGVPAREVNGYAFTDANENLPTISDVLHAWVQVYLPDKGWVQIDPTWGSTAHLDYFSHFDTNHVIFALKGQSSEYPYPAGSYKIEGETTEDVHVSFSDTYVSGGLPITLWAQQWEETHEVMDIIDWVFQFLLRFV
jgi:transglutaminase-like putative cysteine protease